MKLNRLPFSVARWPKDKNGQPIADLKGGLQIYRDMNEHPVILLNQEWDLKWAERENPDIEFANSISRAR